MATSASTASPYREIALRARVAREISAPPGVRAVPDDGPARRRGIVAADEIGHGPRPDLTCFLGERAEVLFGTHRRGEKPVAGDQRAALSEVKAREPGPGEAVEQAGGRPVELEVVSAALRCAALDVVDEILALDRRQRPVPHQHLGERHEILELRSGKRRCRRLRRELSRRGRGGVSSPAGGPQHPRRIEPQRRRDSEDQAPSSERHRA